MSERTKTPIRIVGFLASIILLDIAYLVYQGNYLLFDLEYLTEFLSFSTSSMLMWIDLLLVLLSLVIIPYGFLKRKNGARLFAFIGLSYSIIRVLIFMFMTREKIIGFLLFTVFVILMMYLLMSDVTKYFRKTPLALIPSETMREYTFGLYTLYSKLVQLKNGKKQIIYFFSKKTPKSGTPTTLPGGFYVEVSERSGMPYLKKDPRAFSSPS